MQSGHIFPGGLNRIRPILNRRRLMTSHSRSLHLISPMPTTTMCPRLPGNATAVWMRTCERQWPSPELCNESCRQQLYLRVLTRQQFRRTSGSRSRRNYRHHTDEAMGKANKLKSKVALTRRMQVEYLRPVPLGQPLVVEAACFAPATASSTTVVSYETQREKFLREAVGPSLS